MDRSAAAECRCKQLLEKLELHRAIAKQLSGLGVTEDIAESVLKNFNTDIKSWNDNDLLNLSRAIRMKTKPLVITANKIDVPGAENNFRPNKGPPHTRKKRGGVRPTA